MSTPHAVSARRFLECVDAALALPPRAFRRVGILHVAGGRSAGSGGAVELRPPEVDAIARHMRDGDVLGRLGVSEYAVLSEGVPAEIIARADRLAASLQRRRGGSATVDVAIATDRYEPARLLIARARAATPPDDFAGPATAPVPVARRVDPAS